MVCHKLPNDKEVRKYKENQQIRRAKSALSNFLSSNKFWRVVTFYAKEDFKVV